MLILQKKKKKVAIISYVMSPYNFMFTGEIIYKYS